MRKNKAIIMTTCYIIGCLLSGMLGYLIAVNNIPLSYNGERSQLYNETNKDTTYVNGVAFGHGYYCVWTKGRTLKDINRTDSHEVCHRLVGGDFKYFDKEHFCE